jgi:quercetin dioxygenase-like cupin family protein
MRVTRRELSALLPALAAAQTAPKKAMASRVFLYEDLPVKANGENRSRAFFNGETHTGYAIEMHETSLGPGMAPHGAHSHAHEELVIVREGTVEVTIAGKKSILTPGSVAYVASGEEHGVHNAGQGRATYYIMTLGRSR